LHIIFFTFAPLKLRNRLKKKFSISFIAIATLLIQVFAVLPHHHHAGVACVIMERCEQDGAINDEHTHHGDATGNHGQSCIAGAEYTAVQSGNETKCKVSCDNPGHTHLYPILFPAANFLAYNLDSFNNIKPEYGEYTLCYKPAETSRFHGLRAPPSFLS
jgi:hypothetical protein